MAVCFTNPEDKKAYDANARVFGPKEALRDYINYGRVRNLDEISRSIEQDLLFDTVYALKEEKPTENILFSDKENPLDIFRNLLRIGNKKESLDFVKSMSRRMGVSYQIVSLIEAQRITGRTKFNGGGFYKGGEVYLIEGEYNSDSVFHEFAHPIIKALALENPELFNSLLNIVPAEFRAEVIDQYKDEENYNPESKEFQEEILVQYLEKSNREEVNEPKSIIGKIIYAIKRFLRSKFGKKINLKNLSPDTTLSEFVEMLNYGQEFIYDKELITEDDFLYLQNKLWQKEKQITQETQQKAQQLVDLFAETIQNQINNIKNSKASFLEETMLQRKSVLEIMQQQLTQLKSVQVPVGELNLRLEGLAKGISEESFNEAQEQQILTARFSEFIFQISQIDVLTDQLQKVVAELPLNTKSQEDLDKLQVVSEYLNNYSNFLENALSNKYGIESGIALEVREELRKTEQKVNNVLDRVNDIRVNIVTDVLYDHFVSKTERGSVFYEEMLKKLKESGNKSEYDRVHNEYYGLTEAELKEYNRLETEAAKEDLGVLPNIKDRKRLEELREYRFKGIDITKDEFKRLLVYNSGQNSVGQFFNSMLESYNFNQDKVTGTFFSYMTKNMDKINAMSNNRQVVLLQDQKLYNLMNAAGYGWGTRNFAGSKVGRELGSMHNIGRWDEKNLEWTDYFEWRFKSNFIDFDLEIKKRKKTLELAQQQYALDQLDASLEAVLDAEEDVYWFKRDYMHDEAIPQYYTTENLLYTSFDREIRVENIARQSQGKPAMTEAQEKKFRSKIKDKVRVARKARTALKQIYQDVNLIGNQLDAMQDSDIANGRNEKFREIYALRSTYENGKKKTGDDLAVAELLQEYQKGRLGKFESVFLDVEFKSAYNHALDIFGIDDVENMTQAQEELLDDWFSKNTQVAIEDSYFDLISQYIDRRAQLLKPLEDKNNLEKLKLLEGQGVDISEAQRLITEVIRKTRTDSNEYNGDFLSFEEQQAVRDAHQLIENFNKLLYTRRGVTGVEFDRYRSIMDFVNQYGEYNLSEIDREFLNKIEPKLRAGLTYYDGIDEIMADEIMEIDKALRSLSTPLYTGYYLDHWQKAFDESSALRDLFNALKKDKILIDEADAFGELEPSDTDEWEDVELGYQITQKDVEFLLRGRNKDKLEDEVLSDPDLIDFAEWFNNNHYEGDVFEIYDVKIRGSEHLSSTKGENNLVYKSTNAWRNYIPKDKNYYKTYEMLDDAGNTIGLLQDSKGRYRIPNINFQSRELKEEWKTTVINRDVVDEDGIVSVLANRDETTNRWLPRDYFEDFDGNADLEQGSAISPLLIDESYKGLSDNGLGTEKQIAKIHLLDHLKNWHLDNQVDQGFGTKLGLAYPKLRMEGGEDLRELALLRRSYWERRARRLGEYFGRAADDDYELEFNRAKKAYDKDKDAIVDQEISLSRPVSGNYSIPVTEVTTDILFSLQRYQHSLQEHRVFNQMFSFANTLQYAMKDHNRPVGSSLNKAAAFMEKKEMGIRGQAINNIIDRYYKGIQLKEFSGQYVSGAEKLDTTSGGRALIKARENITRSILKLSSRQFFLFNIMSSITNTLSAETQIVYKLLDSTITGRWFNVVDYGVGHAKALRVLSEYNLKTYSLKGKSAQMQLMDILDASPDKYIRNQSDAGGRTVLEDVAKLRPGYAFRAFSTHEVNYSSMYSFMNNKKFRFKLNGKNITLDQAVELVDGRVQTKAGVPEEYSITYKENGDVVFGKEILRMMDLHKGFLSKVHGMGGERSEAEWLTRTWWGKVMSFLFRFLPPMVADKYQFRIESRKGVRGTKRRLNYMTEEFENGTFLEGFKLFISLAQSGYSVVNPNQKATNFVKATQVSGALQTLAAWMFGKLLFGIMYGLLGFDDRDDETIGGDPYTLGMFGPVHGTGYKSADTQRLLKTVGAIPDLPFVSDSYRQNWSNGEWKGFMNEPNWWNGQLLRLLNRVERENATFFPYQLYLIFGSTVGLEGAAFGGSFKNITDLLAWGFATVGHEPEDTDEEYGYSTNQQSKDNIGNRALGPYVWGESGKYKLWHLVIDRYLGFNGALINPYQAFLDESNYNPHLFKHPWSYNPFLSTPIEERAKALPPRVIPPARFKIQTQLEKEQQKKLKLLN